MALRIRAACSLVIFLAIAFEVNAAPGSNELVHVRLQLKWHHQFQFAGYYAAIEKGFYKDAGLDVQLIEGEPGIDPIKTVLSGKAEFGVGMPDLLLAYASGAPVVVLGVIFQHSPYIFLSLQNSSVKTIHDLIGKRVMIEPEAAELYAYLRRERMMTDGFVIVFHSFNVQDLIDQKVDCMSAYSTDECYLLHAKNIPATILSPRSAGVDFYGDCFFTTRKLLAEQPERVKAFHDATIKGWEYALSHVDETVDLIETKYHSEKSRGALLFEADQMQELIHPEIVPVGYMYLGRWEHIMETYEELGMLDAPVNLDKFLYQPQKSTDFTALYWALGCVSVAGAGLWLVLWIIGKFRREIDERKRVEHALSIEKERLSLACKAGGVGIYEMNLVDENVVWNDVLFEIHGTRPQDFIPTRLNVHSLVHPHDLGTMKSEFNRCMKLGIVYNWEYRMSRAGDGMIRVIRDSAIVLADEKGQAVRAVGAVLDITGHKATEEELIRAREAAEAASTARSSFLNQVSHDLRTPLHSIHMLCEMVHAGSLEAQQSEKISMISTATIDLLQVVDDLLDVNRIESGRFDLADTPFQLDDILDDIVRLLAVPAQKKGVEILHWIEPGLAGGLRGDPQYFRQILFNLIGNAMKFTNSGHIAIIARKNARGWLEIDVEDTGPGIPEQTLSAIFEPFIRAQLATEQKISGTGLGLTIVRRLAEMMGGTVRVLSIVGKGSIFTVEIPMIDESAVGPEIRDLMASLDGSEVFVACDNRLRKKAILAGLSSLGLRARAIDIDQLPTHSPALVDADLMANRLHTGEPQASSASIVAMITTLGVRPLADQPWPAVPLERLAMGRAILVRLYG